MRDGYRAGCELLRHRIEDLNLAIHQFGHIHEAYGVDRDSIPGTVCVNASVNTLYYEPDNEPLYFFIDPETKETRYIKHEWGEGLRHNIVFEGKTEKNLSWLRTYFYKIQTRAGIDKTSAQLPKI